MERDRNISLSPSRRTILKTLGVAGLTILASDGAVAQATDRETWVFDVGDLVVSSPTVVENTVYVGSNGSDILAIDKSTGDQKWVFETGSFVNSSPAVVGDTLYVGSNDNKVYAINRDTGEKRWEFDTGDKIRSSPTVANGTVFIGNGDFQDPVDTSLYAIDADTGQEQWRSVVEDRISSAPIVDEGTVYVTSTDGMIYAFNTEDGSYNWSEYIGAGRGSPTIVGETVYAPGFNGIYALDKETGSEEWKYEEEISFIESSPTVADGVLYVGLTSANKLSAIDTDSGSEIWEFSTANAVYSSPTYVNETVFIGDDDGNVYSIDGNTGEEKWQFSADDEVNSSPIVVDGTLYVGSTSRDPYGGSVYAIDTDISGSSEGSRATFGTLGHNQLWADSVSDNNDQPTQVPSELDGEITAEQYTAVLDGGDTLNAGNLSSAVNQWATTGTVNGAEIGAGELSSLVNYWAA